MPQATGSRRQLAIIPEVTFGVTPPTPQTQAIEFVNFTGNMNADVLTDPSIRPDRQTSYARRGNSSTEGELEVVLVPDNCDALLEAALQGTWTTNVLKIGSVQRSFAIEEGYLDLGQYRTFNGVMVNSMSIAVSTDDIVNATFGLMGTTVSAFTGTSIDSTPTPVIVKDRFFHDGGSFNEGGASVAYISSISFELNNNISGNRALGTLGYRNMTSGKVEVTGSVTGLFESEVLANKYRNNTDSSLSFTLVAGAETLKFEFPRIKFTSSTITSSGDAGVTVEMGWTALYDGVAANTMMVTRV